MGSGKTTPRVRRKPAAGADHVKHRRTRSGCYTCRSRRVKCDETHPVCERCRKGGRECIYPENPITSKSTGGSSKKGSVAESSSSGEEDEDDEDDEDDANKLETIADDEPSPPDRQRPRPSIGPAKGSVSDSKKPRDQSGSRPGRAVRAKSSTPSLMADGKSESPSTEGSTTFSGSYASSAPSRTPGKQATPEEGNKVNCSHLPRDLQFYLHYFQTQVTHHHYSFKNDIDPFLRTTYLEIALKNPPLLHAIVGFAAFQHTLRKPDGRIQNFLGYYNRSVTLLRQSLQKSQRHTEATLLTILQLATIEEYLGDWVNLLGHQKAAYEILTGLYDAQSVMLTPVRRIIFSWYARFDLFAGIQAGYETSLNRDWYHGYWQHYFQQSRQFPENVSYKIQEAVASHRLLAMDLAILFAKHARKSINPEDFIQQNDSLARRLASWKTDMDPALRDPNYLITSFSNAREPSPDNIVNPYVPGILFRGPLWTMNFAMIDWYAIDMMHKAQTAMALQTQPPSELRVEALRALQLFEAIEVFPESPPGAVIMGQASLGIASLFLPKDERHTMWVRRKLAKVESLGWIYPPKFRTRMADTWGIPEVKHWWLPNNEGYPHVVRSIRTFIEDRTMAPKDQGGEDLRDMKGLFKAMTIDDGPADDQELIDPTGKGKQLDNMGLDSEFAVDDFLADPGFDAAMIYAENPELWDTTPAEPGHDLYDTQR